jgi:hypothetical protein
MPITQLGKLAADPLHASASLAETLGVDWDEALGESVGFLRDRLRGEVLAERVERATRRLRWPCPDPVTAPTAADETIRAYFAITPVL